MPDGLHRYDVLGEFRDSFAAAGLVAPAEIIADGNYHRCDVIGKRPRNNAGRYKVYLDRWPAGVLQNFVESSLEIWHPKSRGHKPSADERSERKRYYEEKRAEAEADLADEQARVAITAEWRWSRLSRRHIRFASISARTARARHPTAPIFMFRFAMSRASCGAFRKYGRTGKSCSRETRASKAASMSSAKWPMAGRFRSPKDSRPARRRSRLMA
jgi:hypothetical protein